ncbi:hypothetical protein L1049_001550 [Liquidambar formosana]|uniref:FLZ-type domain-containing protein n=1 Tax=Liquidambar formosana TaxID=63359 RepID=A0AAP0R4I1_LIQFO
MADFKRLTINLSLFATDQGSKSPNSNSKSPRNFENGIVGLGIVAAMNDLSNTHQAYAPAKSSRASAILAVTSPRSNPIPIDSKSAVNPNSKKDMVEMSESYTCVISHIGNDLVKKREYFDDDDDDHPHKQHPLPANRFASTTTTTTTTTTTMTTSFAASGGVFAASPPSFGEVGMMMPFSTADFLSSCFLCKKKLHGLDIFMYRGEKAFCSAECRSKQMISDDRKEKCGSGAMKPLAYSVSPCSGPMMFYAGVAAA